MSWRELALSLVVDRGKSLALIGFSIGIIGLIPLEAGISYGNSATSRTNF